MSDESPAERARRVLEGTTPGPWFTEHGGVFDEYRSYLVVPTGDSDQDRTDAELIAAAPDLARTVLSLSAENEVLRDTAKHLHADLLATIEHWEMWNGSCCPCDNTLDVPCRQHSPFKDITPDEARILRELG